MDKIYFWDNGIRNGVLGRTIDMSIRQDKGQLFENFIISELMKKKVLFKNSTNYFFWRMGNNKEIDIIQENPDGSIQAYECKYVFENIKIPSGSPVEEIEVINSKNYSRFL